MTTMTRAHVVLMFSQSGYYIARRVLIERRAPAEFTNQLEVLRAHAELGPEERARRAKALQAAVAEKAAAEAQAAAAKQQANAKAAAQPQKLTRRERRAAQFQKAA